MKKRVVTRKVILAVLLCFILVGICTVLAINAYVKHIGAKNILTPEEALLLSDVDCILVLGCHVKENGEPSDMLADRLARGVELYNSGAAPKLLMSGDHRSEEYNEVGAMKAFAVDEGISSKDIFMDHNGFSTYESLYRAKNVFCADKIIIVTQKYHLLRALYIADALGIEAYGVASDYNTYMGQTARDIREVLARVKDFAFSSFKPVPANSDYVIPVSGNGDETDY